MADKDKIICNEIKVYSCVDHNDEFGNEIRLAELEWNHKPSRGVDIRKYDTDKNMYLKGIIVSYAGFEQMVKDAILGGLIDTETVEEILNERKKHVFTPDKFADMFDGVEEDRKYKRDKDGILWDDDGFIVMRRNK